MNTDTVSFCCALQHLGFTNHDSKSYIINTMNSYKDSSGRTTFFVIATSAEKKLQKTLKEIGFIELVQFNRKNIYDTRVKLKMFFIEPIWKDRNVIGNKAILPVVEATPPVEAVIAPVKRPVGRPRKIQQP